MFLHSNIDYRQLNPCVIWKYDVVIVVNHDSVNMNSSFVVILAVGVKESSVFNNIFTGVNLLVVLYVVICGLFKADINNWTIPKDHVRHRLSCTSVCCLVDLDR